MTEQRESGSVSELAARIGSPEFRQAMRDAGITTAQAVERLREAAEHFDADEFDLLIAAQRPGLWKRMNRRPSRLARLRGQLLACLR